jgi:hypothetical protein
MEFLNQPLDALTARDRFVVVEVQLGGPAQAQAACQLVAKERGRPLQGASGVAPRAIVAEGRVVDTRHLQVGADLDVGHREEPDSGILDLVPENRPEILANLLAEPHRPGTLHPC